MVSRRQVVAGLGAVAVYGFNPVSRTWVGSANAAPTLAGIPALDGELVTDPASLAPFANDVGGAIHETPVAVLRPGSAEDIAKMIRFCRKRRIKVAARGQGHTTFGQAQTTGLVVDMSSLSALRAITSQTRNGKIEWTAEVDAGLTWRTLLESTEPQGLTPPVLTGYIKLSIGGTLSVGGVSSSYSAGCQVDRVREIEVVTGEGLVKRCSKIQNCELFESVLAGLGQCAIITRVWLELVTAPKRVRNYVLRYTNNATFFRDMNELLRRGEADDISCIWMPDANGKLVYGLNVAKYYGPSAPPDVNQLLANLSQPAAAAETQDQPFFEYAIRVDMIVDFFDSIGLFKGTLHPWFDVWLPQHSVERYIGEVIPSLTMEDVGPTGFLLLFPQRAKKLTRPLLRVPEFTDWVFLFDILTAAPVPGPDPAFQAKMVARNRRLFEKARRMGGTRYPIGTLEFSKLDWVLQYGLSFLGFKFAKSRFDPDNILTPGPGVF